MSLDLNKAHRRELNTLTDLARRDLAKLWHDVGSAEVARDALMDILPRLIEVYGSAAATLSADFYDDMREAAAVKGSFRAIPAKPTDPRAIETLARWAVSPLFSANPDPESALSLASGGMQRSIANSSRLTVVESSIQDPGAEGWIRVGAGECVWCQQYLDGEVHYTEGYDFDAHNNCKCTAVSVFTGQSATALLRDVQGERPEPRKRPNVLGGIDALNRQQVEKQISILEGLKDSDYKTAQLGKLRDRLSSMPHE